MPSDNPKKLLRIPPHILQAAELYCDLYDKELNTFVTEALEGKLAPTLIALRTAKMMGIPIEELAKKKEKPKG